MLYHIQKGHGLLEKKNCSEVESKEVQYNIFFFDIQREEKKRKERSTRRKGIFNIYFKHYDYHLFLSIDIIFIINNLLY